MKAVTRSNYFSNGKKKGRRSSSSLTVIDQHYEDLQRMRVAMRKAQRNFTDLLDSGRTGDAIECEIGLVHPALEGIVRIEKRILQSKPRTARDLAVKIAVCADNGFASDLLNSLLEKDARHLLARS